MPDTSTFQTATSAFPTAEPLIRGGTRGLAEQLAGRIARRVDEHALQAGTRLASIRDCALEQQVSRSTVVDAYDRLVASGHVESRRGAGFFVRARPAKPRADGAATANVEAPSIDIAWLLHSMLRQAPAADQPGGGLLPPAWLDSPALGAALRAVARVGSRALLSYGVPAGYLPLRQQLTQRLAHYDIDARPDQIVVTGGATEALDLVARQLTSPGDTVLVEDPAWYVLFGRFASFGLNLVGVPRRQDGPDLDVLAALLVRHRPKLFVVNSVLHNPTGTSISAAVAHRLLQLAAAHGCTIVEDDVYGDLLGGRALRLASLDQLRGVVHVGGFSKTLAPGLRVGYVAAEPELAARLVDLKLLTGLTSPELTERVVARFLAEGHYRRHVERLRRRLDAARDRTVRALQRFGVRLFAAPLGGMFVWVDCRRDTSALAARAAAQGILCAPGGLFSPTQQPSSWMRIAATTSLNPVAMRFLEQELSA